MQTMNIIRNVIGYGYNAILITFGVFVAVALIMEHLA